MWDLIVSVPDHCLSFYFVVEQAGLTWSQTPTTAFLVTWLNYGHVIMATVLLGVVSGLYLNIIGELTNALNVFGIDFNNDCKINGRRSLQVYLFLLLITYCNKELIL